MKIYTRTGDDGTTGLFGGGRVGKDDPRIECYGTIDELNAALGVAACVAPAPTAEQLQQIQHDLFTIGAHLATPPESPSAARLPLLDETMVSRLEMQIDSADVHLQPLREFILPGGVEAAARLHVARTICRRAERLLTRLALDRPGINPLILVYLNRLSDHLFVAARLANHLAGAPDIAWRKPEA